MISVMTTAPPPPAGPSLPVPPPPPHGQPVERTSVERRRLADPLRIAITGIVIGGAGDWRHLAIGDQATLYFGPQRVAVWSSGAEAAHIEYSDLEELETFGPGVVTEGGGFFGGGLGVRGALAGMAVAGALNALTTKSRVETVLRLSADDLELFVLHGMLTPELLRMELSPVVVAMRK